MFSSRLRGNRTTQPHFNRFHVPTTAQITLNYYSGFGRYNILLSWFSICTNQECTGVRISRKVLPLCYNTVVLSRQIPICQSNVHGSVDCDLHIGTQNCKEGYWATWSGQQARWHLNSLRFPYVQLAIVDTIHKGVPMWDRIFLNLSTRNRGRKQSAIECWFIKVCQPWGEVPLARELELI